jgi:thymidylate kinase
MDEQSIEFHRKVYRAYHDLAAQHPARIRMVDGTASIDAIENDVWDIVSQYV